MFWGGVRKRWARVAASTGRVTAPFLSASQGVCLPTPGFVTPPLEQQKLNFCGQSQPVCGLWSVVTEPRPRNPSLSWLRKLFSVYESASGFSVSVGSQCLASASCLEERGPGLACTHLLLSLCLVLPGGAWLHLAASSCSPWDMPGCSWPGRCLWQSPSRSMEAPALSGLAQTWHFCS